MSILSKKEQTVLDALEDAILILDPNYKIVYANYKFLENRGKSLTEVKGKTCYQLFHNSDKPCQKKDKQCHLKEVLKSLKPVRTTYHEGDIYLEVSTFPLQDKKGKTIGFVESFKDVTQVEREKREYENRYNNLIEKSHDAIAILQDDRIKLANQKIVDLTGYSLEELKELDFSKVISPEFKDFIMDRYRRRNRGEEVPDHYELEIITKKGQRKAIEVSIILTEYKERTASYCFVRDVTEKKKADEVLRESEEKFRTLAEQSPNMIFINKGGRVVYANRKSEDIMGYDRNEFYSPDFNYLKLIAPEHIDTVKESFNKHAKGEEVPPLEYGLVTKKGRKIDAILATKLISYEGENAILGTITDITQRKKTEQKIVQTNNELLTLNTIASIVNQSLNLEEILKESLDKILEVTKCQVGGIYILNKHTQKLELKTWKGFSTEAVKGIMDLQLGEGFSGKIALTGEPMLADDIVRDSRLSCLIKKSEMLHSFLGVPLKSKGKILGTLFVISQKKRGYVLREIQLLSSIGNQIGMAVENAYLFKEAEQWIVQLKAIRNITNRLNKLNDVKTVAFAVRDEIKKVIEFDNCRVFLLNEQRDQLMPIAFGSEVEEYKAETEETLSLKIGEGITGWVAQTGKAQVIDDGERHPRSLHILGTPYVDESMIVSPMIYEGEVRGVITLSKLGLKQFNQNHLTLLNILANEAVVAIENAKLFENLKQAYAKLKEAQEQLIQSEKLRALGEMAGGVAHDFNNLLGAILGRAQLLLLSSKDEKTKRSLEIIEKAALDGADTVRRIQEFTRQRADENFTMVDINEVLRTSLEITKHKWRDEAQKRSVSIQVETSLRDSLPLVTANPSELREVFVNIIINSIDAMPEGGTLFLSTELNKDNIIASISDTGVGMSEEVKRKVFDPFFTTKGPKGNGLGMSVAYGIIIRHNGKILIESQEGEGTTFKVKLPMVKSDDRKVAQEKNLDRKAAENILIIDDEPAIRDLLSDILQSEGHRIVDVDTSLKGLKLFEEDNFGIVFTDLSMPELSGWEIAEKLRSIKPEVVIVMITGWGAQLESKKLETSPVDLLMVKPFEVKELFRILNQAQRIKREREQRKLEMANSKM